MDQGGDKKTRHMVDTHHCSQRAEAKQIGWKNKPRDLFKLEHFQNTHDNGKQDEYLYVVLARIHTFIQAQESLRQSFLYCIHTNRWAFCLSSC